MVVLKNARETALQIAMKIEEENLYANISLNDELNKCELQEQDKVLVTQLVYGVISNKIAIDYIIKKFSKIKFNKIALPILTILRMGIYQIYYLDRIPVSAACNESVKLAKKYGHMSSANFVNAVLRNAGRTEFSSIFDGIESIEERLSVRYSYPLWLIKTFLSEFGFDDAKALLDSNEKVKYETARVNTLKISREDLLKKLTNCKSGKLNDIVYADNIRELLHSDEFKNGLITFQDEAPALVAHLLKPKEGQKILDICAAPGGKTTHIAQLVNDNADIVAMDLYEHRCKLINETAKRLGIKSISVKVADATEFIPEFSNKFDRIVVDVPCSGLGVIRKKPDIKLRIKEEDIDEINLIQKKILENASKYLKKDGILIYSTCTILKRENQDLVKNFLRENDDFKICTDENLIPDEWKSGLKDGMLSLLPSKHETDGFFICAICHK